MSQQPPQDQHDLAQVLNRINALTKNTAVNQPLPEFDEAIPLLTEIYEGEALSFSEQLASPIIDEIKIAASAATLSPELLEQLMVEMQPLIQEAVKKAVKAELQYANEALGTRLEAELTQVLRLKLQAIGLDAK